MANEGEPADDPILRRPKYLQWLMNASMRLADFVMGRPPKYLADDPRYKDRSASILRLNPSELLTLRSQQPFSPTPGLLTEVDPTLRAHELRSSLYQPFRTDLSLARIRGYYCSTLYGLVNHPEELNYSDAEMSFLKREITGILSQTGLALSYDIRTALEVGSRMPEVSPIGKYLTYPEVVQFANQKGLTALVHGSFDPLQGIAN